MMSLVEEEESVKDMQEPVLVERLTKLLMMSINHRLNVMKLNELKRSFGFPDDYLIRIVPKHPEMFRIVNYSGRRSAMEIELLSWNPDLGISVIESLAHSQGSDPRFSCTLPSTWSFSGRIEGDGEEDSRYQIYTVLLREGYNGSELIDKDPLVVVKEKFGELMQEGLHEYNRRHHLMNLEKKKKKGMVLESSPKMRDKSSEMSEQDDHESNLGGLLDPEERKRFYKVLFDDAAS
ncbi:hypothetical protein CK203_017982 [Vitis vinifera]|uniref:PORR domain-containing protein n=1 Tax=Vitis vinifera TaxID=29760 RepID=A0A438JWB1_VITVI|nr:hypothetical protein CK203_017982 [Vitis vinifera]